jgi:flavorubredoxin
MNRSFGWGGKTVKTLGGMIPHLKVEILEPVLCKRVPGETDFKALDTLADAVARKHAENGFK